MQVSPAEKVLRMYKWLGFLLGGRQSVGVQLSDPNLEGLRARPLQTEAWKPILGLGLGPLGMAGPICWH